MTLTPAAFLRAGLIAFATVILQVSGIGSIHVLGAAPNLIPLGVAGVAIYAGSIPGAATPWGATASCATPPTA